MTKMDTRALTWSYGGGTQSVAIAVLVAQGKLPKPECIVIADTGREASETWEYTDKYIRPLLDIEVASHDLANVDLYHKGGMLLLPAWTKPKGQLRTFCSTEWKKLVIRRYLRSRGYGPKTPVTCWMGISMDEVGRVKPSGVRWQELAYPLLDLRLKRADCYRIVEEFGLPRPPKSSCWMCPWRRNSQWRRLRDHYPGDFQKAVELDEKMRIYDSNVYLHDSRQPLRDVDLGKPDKPEDFLLGEVGGCDSGHCWV